MRDISANPHVVCGFTRFFCSAPEAAAEIAPFILATNDLDEKNFSNQQMLSEYKEQQNVEGGFRFLKDPWFMVDSIFLKSAKRIEALMMVRTLCLMVYNIAQYKLRNALKVQNPTMRWIFQIMEGVGVIQYVEKIFKNRLQG